MLIQDVVLSAGRTGFYFDDQRAIKRGAKSDGATYVGKPVTDGFSAIRQAGESISVQFILDDGQIAYGDCAAVQYSGAGGRDPLFIAADFIPFIEKHLIPLLKGREITTFREMAEWIDHLQVEGKRLHTAIRYGMSQAILDAVAKANNKMMCEIIADEYQLEVSDKLLPIFTQSGDDRYANADKMIIKHAAVLPHALINNVEIKLGQNGEVLEDYVKWLSDRIPKISMEDDYTPVIHIDVYGTIGQLFGPENYDGMADYLERLAKAAKPYLLRIEGPMDVEEREEQMKHLQELTRIVDERGIAVELVADEWCNTLDDIKYFADNKAGHMIQIKTPDLGSLHNTVEAVLYCKDKGVSAYQGGTCNETDRSCQVCVHCAMATSPDQILAKPGMGVDEGFMIVYNEMQRILAVRKARK